MKLLSLCAVLLLPALAAAQVPTRINITLGSGTTLTSSAFSSTAASGSAAFSAKNGARFVFDSDVASASYLSLASSLITGTVGFSAPTFAASVASGSVGVSVKAGAKVGLNNDGANTYTLSEDGTNILLAAPTGKGFKFTVNGSDELVVTSAGAVTATSTLAAAGITSTIASGSNAFGAATNGSRIDFGAGASDYASSDGTTVTFAGPVNHAAGLTSNAILITDTTTGSHTLAVGSCDVGRPCRVRTNTGASTATITNFTGASDGQILVVYNTASGAVTIDRTTAVLPGAANVVLAQYECIQLIWVSADSLWHATGPKANNG